MRLVSRMLASVPVLALLVMAGCSSVPGTAAPPVAQDMAAAAPVSRAAQTAEAPVRTDAVSRLAAEILALGPDVDPQEAARAAQIAYRHSAALSREYQITDGPIIHNIKVNMGVKPRGLCWHWAQDMEERLRAESFRTLQMHRAIANFDQPLQLEHSTAIISRRGDDMHAGIVLDPWRKGGRLTWMRAAEDKRYDWHPRDEVLALKTARQRASPSTAGSEG